MPLQQLEQHEIRVLLIDDQPMIGEAVRRMLDDDIAYAYCQDPTQALQQVREFKPTVILQDLVMPQLDGLTLVKFLRADPQIRKIPLIVLSSKEEPVIKAEAFARGANDYLVKLPDKLELLARIRYHSKGYIHLLERDEAYNRLVASQELLAAELQEAADYVISLLPERLNGSIVTDWKFTPSTSLGGDSFGYHWLDDDHFALYLLDVCGHGVGAALLSVTVMNVLRGGTLPDTDFLDPGDVLAKLNDAFQMERQNNMYFTMWYGVYERSSRRLTYSSGGHPPAIVLHESSPGCIETRQLKTRGMVIGGMPGMPYTTDETTLAAGDRVYLFSDGVYEIVNTETGELMTFERYLEILSMCVGQNDVERVWEAMCERNVAEAFEDDFSLVELQFND